MRSVRIQLPPATDTHQHEMARHEFLIPPSVTTLINVYRGVNEQLLDLIAPHECLPPPWRFWCRRAFTIGAGAEARFAFPGASTWAEAVRSDIPVHPWELPKGSILEGWRRLVFPVAQEEWRRAAGECPPPLKLWADVERRA